MSALYKSLGSTLSAALLLCTACGDGDGTQTTLPPNTAADTPTRPPGTPTQSPSPPPSNCTDDLDGDGYISTSCVGGDDCNDVNVSVYPGAAEGVDNNGDSYLDGDTVDNDCDGIIDEGTDSYDNDGDGYSSKQGDCNDSAPGINPSAEEECDGVDNDCNAVIDDRDKDADAFISAACGGDDCDDFNPETYPGAPEGADSNGDGILEANGADNDCDQVIDETTDVYDDDLDGFSELQGDCDDEDILVYPGAIERFDDKDQNCDGDLSAVPSALAAPASVVGTLAEAAAGSSIDGVGDVDGDGIGDLLIGAPTYDEGGTRTGAAFLLAGREKGWDVDMPIQDLPTFTLVGAPGSLAGFAVAGVGDMTGDGKNDFVIGAPGYAANNNANSGGIFLYQGQDTPWTDQTLGQQVTYGGSNSFGVTENVEMGYSLAGSTSNGACDVTGDGINDLLIGGPWDAGLAQGYLMLLPGEVSPLGSEVSVFDLTSYPGGTDEALGYAVACIGDSNGLPEPTGAYTSDILVAGKGTSDQAGVVYWLSGRDDFQSTGPKLMLPSDAVPFVGTPADSWLGYSVTGLGDTDGDGLSDYALSRGTKASDQTIAHVVFSDPQNSPQGGVIDSLSTLRITGQEDDKCPCVVQGIGDFNKDGMDDMLISASGAGGTDSLPERSGRVYLFLGKVGGWGAAGTSLSVSTADYSFAGAASGDQFGFSLAKAGDLNGDGFADFAIGAPTAQAEIEDVVADEAGRVYIFFGFQTN